MSTAIIAAIAGAAVGAVVGAVATWLKAYVDSVQGSRRHLFLSALTCLGRLEKIERVRVTLREENKRDFESLPDSDPRKKTINDDCGSWERVLTAT